MTEINATPLTYAEAVKTLRILNDPRTASNLLRYAMNRFPGSPELTGLVKGG